MLPTAAGTRVFKRFDEEDEMDEAEMAAWMKYASPNENHDFLKKLEGKWNCKTKFWMQPGADPAESSGTAENKMELDGRFLHCNYNGNMMGQPFLGMSIDGFDNQKQKYVGVWIDTMGTMILQFEGTCDGTVREMIAEYQCPMTNTQKKTKGVTTVVGADEHRYEGFNVGPDGEFFRNLEVVYTRQ